MCRVWPSSCMTNRFPTPLRCVPRSARGTSLLSLAVKCDGKPLHCKFRRRAAYSPSRLASTSCLLCSLREKSKCLRRGQNLWLNVRRLLAASACWCPRRRADVSPSNSILAGCLTTLQGIPSIASLLSRIPLSTSPSTLRIMGSSPGSHKLSSNDRPNHLVTGGVPSVLPGHSSFHGSVLWSKDGVQPHMLARQSKVCGVDRMALAWRELSNTCHRLVPPMCP